MANETVRLVTRGDDAGLAQSVNDAIRECYEAGVLRNVSVMAPCPELEHAAERLAGLDGLCVGVHLTLTAEWDRPNWGPVLPPGDVPSLVDADGNLPRLAGDFVERDPDREEVFAEVDAQVERVREVGFEPSYLDTHMAIERHLDWFAEALADRCEREGLVNGPAVPLPPGAEGAGTGPEWLLDRIDEAEPGTYLVVGHPAYEDEETAAIVGPGNDRGDVAADRAAQRRMFTNQRVRERCERNDVAVHRYDEL
ncbi:MAG: carbohydrate deacetylase [Haloarculaceae archaeon]